ncbi:MAG: Lrp/AsnC family transcriptional regulator [Candidatus Thorarchaeota archaeon]
MVKAYVLIKTENGVENQVLRQILDLSVTEEAHLTFGPYDIIAEVKGRDMESLVEIITMKIRPIKGIKETQSLMAIDVEIDMSSTSLAS